MRRKALRARRKRFLPQVMKDSARVKRVSARVKRVSAQVMKDSAQVKSNSARVKSNSARVKAFSARVKAFSAEVKRDSARVKRGSAHVKAYLPRRKSLHLGRIDQRLRQIRSNVFHATPISDDCSMLSAADTQIFKLPGGGALLSLRPLLRRLVERQSHNARTFQTASR
jgi:hypothetical protein